METTLRRGMLLFQCIIPITLITHPFPPRSQFDPEGFGEIPVDDFIESLKSQEFLANVPPNKRDILYDRALKAKSSKAESISFQDFVNVVSASVQFFLL